MATHVLLMRHGKHRPCRLAYLPPKESVTAPGDNRELTENGQAETAEVASALSQHLKQENSSFRITNVVHAPSQEAKETAVALLRNLPELDQIEVEEWPDLDPKETRNYVGQA